MPSMNTLSSSLISSKSSPSHSPFVRSTIPFATSSTFDYRRNISPALISIDNGDGSNGSSRLIIKSKSLGLPAYTPFVSIGEKWLDGTAIAVESSPQPHSLPTSTLSPSGSNPLSSGFFTLPFITSSPSASSRSISNSLSNRSTSFINGSAVPSLETLRNRARAVRYRESLFYSLEVGSNHDDHVDAEELEFEGSRGRRGGGEARGGASDIHSARIFILPSYTAVDIWVGKKTKGSAGKRGGSNEKRGIFGAFWEFLKQPNRLD